MDTPSASRQLKVTMMLADAATVAEGKLNVLGGGWNVTGPGPTPFAIAVLFEVPWHLTNEKHRFRFDLIDQDGTPAGPVDAEGPLVIEGEFEVGRPPGVQRGSDMPMPFVVSPPGPIQFPPGARLEFRLTIDDQTREDWRLAFSTRSVLEMPRAA